MRQDFGDYRGDVLYDVWCSGGNPDAVNDDRIQDAYDSDTSAEAAAQHELHRQRQLQQEFDEERQYEEYCRQQEQEYYREMEEHHTEEVDDGQGDQSHN